MIRVQLTDCVPRADNETDSLSEVSDSIPLKVLWSSALDSLELSFVRVLPNDEALSLRVARAGDRGESVDGSSSSES